MCLEIIDNLIQSIFKHSPFCAMSVNEGPQAEVRIHCDVHNLIWGFCALGIFGSFDHTKSGQLILWEAKVIIELKHGDANNCARLVFCIFKAAATIHPIRLACIFGTNNFHLVGRHHRLTTATLTFFHPCSERYL